MATMAMATKATRTTVVTETASPTVMREIETHAIRDEKTATTVPARALTTAVAWRARLLMPGKLIAGVCNDSQVVLLSQLQTEGPEIAQLTRR